MSGKKIGRHDKMMAMLADSSDSDAGETPSKAQTNNKAAKAGAIRPVANPIPTVGKKKALQAQAQRFGAALNDSDDDDFDKPVMAKATPKVFNNNSKNNDKRKEAPFAQPTVDNKNKKVAIAPVAPPKKQQDSAPNTTFTIEAATAAQMATSAAKKSTEPTTGKVQRKALFDDDEEETEQADTFTLSAADTEGLSKKALAAINAPGEAISINKNYADRYDAVKRKQELQQLADKYKLEYDEEESDETDEEEDEDGDALNDEVSDELWAEVFYRLRRNDPTITDKSVGFFKALEEEKKKRAEQSQIQGQNKTGGDESSDGEESESDGEGGRRRKKRYTLKDEYQRAIVGGEAYDETANNLIDEDDRPGKLKPRTAAEKAAKAAFLNAIGGATVVTADKDDDDAIIKKKEGGLSSAEIYGDKDKSKKSAKEKKHVSALAEAFSALSNTATDEEKQQEAFLKSFFLNEKWREDGDNDSEDNDNEYMGAGINKKGMKHGDVNWEQLAKEDQDEVFFDEAEQWEREFQNKQFHHEMVDSTEDLQIKSFPRRATLAAAATPNMSTVGSVQISTLKSVAGEQEAVLSAVVGGGDGLLRKQESTRKEQRKRKAERAAEAEAQRVEELKRLKTLKRMEIEEKRDMIARVAGFLKGGTNANTNDASLDEFNLENPFAENSSDPKDDKKKSKKNKAVAPVEGNHKLLEQLSKVWSNEELEKEFDSDDFDKKMAALFDTDEFNNDIDEEEIARIRAEIEADGDDFGGDDEDDEGLDAEELAEKLLNEEVDVGFGDENGADGEGLFFTNNAVDADDDEEGNGGILGDDELFGDLKSVLSIDKKKKKKSSKAVEEDEDDEANELYGSTAATSNAALGATDDDDDLTALLYPTAALSKMEKEAAVKAQKKEGTVFSISATSKKSDLQSYLGDLQKELDAKVDEYNKLHYDKVLSGGLKTRFRYRSVPAENFGLTDEDILTKDDRTLNMIAPMKLYGAYFGPKENKRDRQRCVARIQNLRQLDPTRRSRRYGDVAKTILFDTGVSEEEGKAMAARVRLSTRKLLATNDAEEVAVETEEELKKIRKAKKDEAKSKSKSGDGETAAASEGGAQKRPRDSAAEERGGFRGRGRGAGFHRGGSSSDRGGPRFERDNNNNFGRGRGNNFGSGGHGGRGGFGASGRGGGGSFRGGNNNSFGRGGFAPRGGRGGNQQQK